MATPGTGIRSRVSRLAREEGGRVIALLAARFGDLDLADDSVQDALLRAIENWDAGIDPASPDSKDFLAPLKAAKVSTAGATISLDQGVVTIKAGGKTTTYSTSEGTYSPVQ